MNNSLKETIIKLFLLSSFLVFFVFFLSSFLLFPLMFFPSFLFLAFFVFLYNITEDYRKGEGLFLAVFSGFLFDIFSSGMPVGFYALLFFVSAYLIKIVLKRYVGISVFS